MRSGWLAVLLWLSLGVILGALLVGVGQERSAQTQPWFGGSADVAPLPNGSDSGPGGVAADQAMGFVDAARIPSLFARRLALVQLTAKADADELERYFVESDRITLVSRRIEALEIVLLRSIELDPELALSMLSSLEPPYDRQLSFRVWRAWGEGNFEAALTAAAAQSLSDRYAAAEGLYAAAGDLESPEAREVEAKLGIAPSREMRRRYVIGLVDNSLEEALAYVSLMTSPLERREAIAWIAEYLSPVQLSEALLLPEGLLSSGDRHYLTSAVRLRLAEQDPVGVLESLLQAGGQKPNGSEVTRAMQLLVVEDIELAKAFLERSKNAGNYVMLLSIFVNQFSKADPLAAIAWAKANEDRSTRGISLLSRVLSEVADSQPMLAFQEALALPVPANGLDPLGSVFRRLAARDVTLAQSLIPQIADPARRRRVTDVLVGEWLKTHPEATLDWILTQDPDTSRELLVSAGRLIIRHDIQTAIANLHRLDPVSQRQWRRQIAIGLAERGSIDEALAFARRFEAEPDYENIQVTIAERAAKSDPDLARRIASGLESPEARDRILAETISYSSGMTGMDLEQQLSGISDPGRQFQKATEVYNQMAAENPAGLEHWIRQQSPGPLRDAAIVGLVQQGRDVDDAAHDELIASIEDAERRRAAKRARIFVALRSNPERARELLQDPDITDAERVRYQRIFDRF